MKKLISLILSFATLCFAAATLSACQGEEVFTVPDDCCIVTTDGASLSTREENVTCERIETAISGIEKDKSLIYYCVTDGAKVEISYEHWHQGVIGKKYTKNVLTGYEIDGEFIEGECGAAEYTINESCHIKRVTENYAQMGIIFVADSELSEREYYDINRYLDADNNIKDKDNVYYLNYNGGNFYERDSWETNLNVSYFGCIYRPFPNPLYPNVNQYHGSAWSGYVASITVENFLTEQYNNKIVKVNLGKTESGKYFVESAVCGVVSSDDIDAKPCEHLFIGDNFLELYFVN